MKQQLWILNSSLLFILVATIGIGIFLEQKAPKFRAKKAFVEKRKIERPLKPEEAESIYKYDLFGTFVGERFVPTAKELVTPIPPPKQISVPKPPELPKPEFLPALDISLKGIAFSSDEEKSISIIEDETKKENVYHSGDKIKDAQLIKIGQNKITILRVNGQHETIFLRKEDYQAETEEKKSWDHVVKKIDENSFEIDIFKFPKKIKSLGSLVEMLSLLTVYTKGKPIGLKVANLTPESIGPSIGLEKSDIITSINGIETSDKKNRIKIYDTLTKTKKDDSVKIKIKRKDKDITLNYKLTEIKDRKKRVFPPEKKVKDDDKKEDETALKLSKLQEREKRRREFKKKHKPAQKDVIDEIRKRLLENIKARVRNARIR